MAILVAAGGAALGSAVGLGWQAGWLIGSVAGSLLFPAGGGDTTSEGPRLGDLTVSSSAYGAAVPIGYGTLRMAGTMIWSSGISEQRHVMRSGGKGAGGGSQTAVTYAYFASFALAFGEGPAEDVLRIWADGKPMDISGVTWRWYRGDEAQTADPFISAKIGAANTPAYRGTAYVVFE